MGVIKRGKKYWVEIMVNSRRIREPSPLNTKAGALAYEAEIRNKIATGQPLKEDLNIRSKNFKNFEEFSIAWLESVDANVYKYSELCNKKSFISCHLIPFFGKMEVKQIGDYEIDQFKAYKSKSNLSPKTINNILTTLNVCLKTAKKWKLLPELPEIKLLTTPKSAYKFLTREQLNLLLANVDGMLRDMIIIGAKCGLRFGEIIALTWDSIDLETGEIEINKAVCRGQLGTTKSNRIRTVWAFNETLEMLRRRKQMSNGNNFVFVGETGGFPGQTNCRVHLHRACDKVGLKRVGFHPLRHSYASHANNINANPVGVQQLMGHASFSTTLNYIHTNKEFLRETARLINEETAKNEVKEKSTPNNNYHNFTTIVNSQINSPTRARTHDNNIRLK